MKFDKQKSEDALKRATKGDQDAFSYLYEAYYKHTYVAARDIITSHEECEDIVQEAFMRAFSKLQNGTEITGFGSYMEQTAKNIAKDHIKAREAKKRPDEILSSFQSNESEDDDRDIVDADRTEIQNALLKMSEFYKTPEEQFEEKEVQIIVQEILNELPDYQQESLSLYFMEGMKLKEIAELYGVSENTIKSRVNQGKKKVEKKVIELERTKGIKLHGVAPLTFFFILLHHSSEAKAAELSVSGATFVGTRVAATNTKRTIFNSIKGFFNKSIHVAGKTIGVKVIAAVTVGIIGMGTITGVTISRNEQHNEEIDIFAYLQDRRYDDVCNYFVNNYKSELRVEAPDKSCYYIIEYSEEEFEKDHHIYNTTVNERNIYIYKYYYSSLEDYIGSWKSEDGSFNCTINKDGTGTFTNNWDVCFLYGPDMLHEIGERQIIGYHEWQNKEGVTFDYKTQNKENIEYNISALKEPVFQIAFSKNKDGAITVHWNDEKYILKPTN